MKSQSAPVKKIEVSGPQEFILRSSKPRNLFLGGTGTGKSHLISILSAFIIINFPQIIQFIGANTYGQLSLSTLKRVFDTWKKTFGWTEGVHFVVGKIPPENWPMYGAKMKDYNNVITFNNGAMIFTASLENFRAIDGTEFAIAYLDETKDTREEAVKEVIINRLRQAGLYIFNESIIDQKKVDEYLQSGYFFRSENKIYHGEIEVQPYNALYIFTSPAKVDWINKWFNLTEHYEEIQRRIFSKTDFFSYEDDHRCISISSTYHNEHNLPANYITQLLQDYAGNQHLADIYIYGSPIAKAGGEYLGNFSRLVHVKPVSHNPKLPIHIGFDFNTLPHCTCPVTQLDVDRENKIIYWNFIKAYPSKGLKKHSYTENLANEILSDWERFKAGCYVYGDSTGANSNTAANQDDKHNYGIIKRVLASMMYSDGYRVTRNQSIISRRNFMDKLLSEGTFSDGYKVIVQIDPSCDALIDDFEFCKQDINGHKDKSDMATDQATGKKYQKFGHFIDCAESIAVGVFGTYFQAFKK